jgi:hypothetical protein
MNEEEIERELERLTPAAPPAALLVRLHDARCAPRKVAIFPRWLPLAAAACALLLLQLRPSVQPPLRLAPSIGSVETFQPIETDRYLLSAQDLGVIELQPGRPYRLVHCVWADRETFWSERAASYLEVRQAREQIVPVALETL